MGAGKKIRTFIVSRRSLFREGLVRGLGAEPHVSVAGAAGDPAGLGDWDAFDVVLTDLSSPFPEEASMIMACAESGKLVVILVTPEEEENVFKAMGAGASAYVSGKKPLAEIAAVVADVYFGNRLPYKKRRASSMPGKNRLRRQIMERFPGLTNIERDVLAEICSGSTNREMACSFCVSERTVRRHLTSIYEKLGVKNRTEAIARVLRK